jgi:hypothetical protein
MSRLDQLRQKLAAAEVARDVATAALTEDEKGEIELRRELARVEDERREAELDKRTIDLDRRVDAAREAHPDAKITSLLIDDYDDTFVLMHSDKAYQAYEKFLVKSFTDKKVDMTIRRREFAVASVIDWNGTTDFSLSSTAGGELMEHLKRNSGLVSSIAFAAGSLAGANAEARKS